MNQKKVKHYIKWVKNRIKPTFLALVLLVIFPGSAHSQSVSNIVKKDAIYGPVPKVSLKSYYDGPTLPVIDKRAASRTMIVTVTAYNSVPGQTDDTPFITAYNTHVRDGIVAANFLPKGTIIRFPEVFGDKEFVVEDRMNPRYTHRVDIWMEEIPDARKFGVRLLKMEIL